MKAFFVRWRSARQFREYELYAEAAIGACLFAALEIGGGQEVWQAGTLWKCPGCGDRTVRTEEFLEGLRRAEIALQSSEEGHQREDVSRMAVERATLDWIAKVSAQLFACERDRVYIKDESGPCTFANQTYISRI